ncbi:MAG: hypothetical protein EBR15_08815, partial [Gammaproteobacteria bacterium]|nr:hypothetical protein [Gammaproteobacteria bacterium]
VASGAMLGLPIALKGLIDKGMAAGSADVINGYFIAFMGVAVLFGVFAAIRFYLVTWLGERVVADVRTAVYRNVVRMDPQFFEITRTGEVLSRLTTDTTLVQSISGSGLSIALRSSINLIGSLVLLAITNIKLLALIMVAMPVVIVPVISLGRKLRKLSRSSQDKVADTSGLAGETLNAIQTVQAFTLEELNTQRYADAVRDSFDIAVVRTRVRAWLTALSTMLVFGAITLVLWFGARQVLAGHMTGGELGQFLLLAVYAGVAAASLSEMWSEVQRAAGAMERPVPVPGWTLPGVMTCGAAQTLLKSTGAVPDGRFVLAGSGPLLLLLAAQLVRVGIKPAAILETRPNYFPALRHLPGFLKSPSYLQKGISLLAELRNAGVAIKSAANLRIGGDDRVREIQYDWHGKTQREAVDLVLLHQGIVPNANLAWS